MPESHPLAHARPSAHSLTERERRGEVIPSARGAGVGAGSGACETHLSRGLELFIDKVANAMQLSINHRAELHAFKELVGHLPESFHRTAVYQLANQFKMQEQLSDLDQKIDFVKTQIQSVNTQLTKRFIVTNEQQAEILTLCKAMVVESNRTEYGFANEALERLKDGAAYPAFIEAFKSRANTKIVLGVVRRQASYSRTSYRASIRDSIFNGKKKCGLTQFLRVILRKFADVSDVDVQMVLHVLVLRQFARDNRELVQREDDEDDDIDDGEVAGDSGGRKRKRGRTKTHFWGEFMRFIRRKRGDWGNSYSDGTDWKIFIESCINEERHLFPDDLLSDLPHTPSSSRPQTIAPSTNAPFSFLTEDLGTFGREYSPHPTPPTSSPLSASRLLPPRTPFIDRQSLSPSPSPSPNASVYNGLLPPVNFSANSPPEHPRLPGIAGMSFGAPFHMQGVDPGSAQYGSPSIVAQGRSRHSPYTPSYNTQSSLSLATSRSHGHSGDFSAASSSQYPYNAGSSYISDRMYMQ